MGYRNYSDYRTRRLEMLCKKDTFKNFTKFRRKHLHWSLFFIKFQTVDLQLYQKETP